MFFGGTGPPLRGERMLRGDHMECMASEEVDVDVDVDDDVVVGCDDGTVVVIVVVVVVVVFVLLSGVVLRNMYLRSRVTPGIKGKPAFVLFAQLRGRKLDAHMCLSISPIRLYASAASSEQKRLERSCVLLRPPAARTICKRLRWNGRPLTSSINLKGERKR